MKEYEDGAFEVEKDRAVQEQEMGEYWTWPAKPPAEKPFITSKGNINFFRAEFIYKKRPEEIPPPRPMPTIRQPLPTGLYMVKWRDQWFIRRKGQDGNSYSRNGLPHSVESFDSAYDAYELITGTTIMEKP